MRTYGDDNLFYQPRVDTSTCFGFTRHHSRVVISEHEFLYEALQLSSGLRVLPFSNTSLDLKRTSCDACFAAGLVYEAVFFITLYLTPAWTLAAIFLPLPYFSARTIVLANKSRWKKSLHSEVHG